ncbi:MAG TPA: hypothetical protein VI456_05420 [Polyangia bacterium]
MKRLSLGRFLIARAIVVAPVALLGWSPTVRADIPPTCDGEASLITCAAGDVGKACQGAGQCYAVPCLATSSGTTSTVYKCDACPTVMPANGQACSTTNLGTACGDGGICMVLSSWCAGASSKFVCATAAAAQPTGPPTGETGAAGAGGGVSGTAGGGGASTSGTAGGGGASTSGTAGGGGASTSGTGGGSSTSGGGGGCAVIAGAPTLAGIAAGLMAIGLGLLALSRRRRAR